MNTYPEIDAIRAALDGVEARLRELERRPTVEVAGPVLDAESWTVWDDGQRCTLKGRAYQAAAMLLEHVGWVRDLRSIWPNNGVSSERVRSLVTELRQRLRAAGMTDLAGRIECVEPGLYRVRPQSESERNPSGKRTGAERRGGRVHRRGR